MNCHWSVYTPTYMDYGSAYDLEPPEYTCDYVEVAAPTKRKALVAGVRALRAMGSDWLLDQQSDGASPFTGLKAESMVCEHGFCHHCEPDICTECTRIAEEEYAKLFPDEINLLA